MTAVVLGALTEKVKDPEIGCPSAEGTRHTTVCVPEPRVVAGVIVTVESKAWTCPATGSPAGVYTWTVSAEAPTGSLKDSVMVAGACARTSPSPGVVPVSSVCATAAGAPVSATSTVRSARTRRPPAR